MGSGDVCSGPQTLTVYGLPAEPSPHPIPSHPSGSYLGIQSSWTVEFGIWILDWDVHSTYVSKEMYSVPEMSSFYYFKDIHTYEMLVIFWKMASPSTWDLSVSHSTLFYLNNSEMVTGRNFTRNKPRIGTVLVRKKKSHWRRHWKDGKRRCFHDNSHFGSTRYSQTLMLKSSCLLIILV